MRFDPLVKPRSNHASDHRTTETDYSKEAGRCDSNGITIELPKASSVTLCLARDICLSLAAGAPTVSGQARGIAQALNRLLDDLSRGPQPIPKQDTEDE